MTWLQPWGWLGLGALAVPILVHLFSRRPARTEVFPSLRFLAPTELRPTRRTRLSDWPLLLVRLAVLLAAVIALAQPVWRDAVRAEASVVSRVRVVDTLVVAASSVPSDSIETITTASLPDGLARATQRLRLLPAPRTLEVFSTFADVAADSAMFAALPRDVKLQLVPRPARSAAGVARADTLTWRTTLSASEQEAVLRAVTSLGGAPVRVERAASASGSLQEVVTADVVMAGAEGHARRSISDRVRQLATDPALQAVRASDERIAVHADSQGVRATVGSARADVALALLMAVGGAPANGPLGAARERSTLDRWSRAPAGAPLGPGSLLTDIHRVATDARWMWLVALLLLGVEALMRRGPRRIGGTA